MWSNFTPKASKILLQAQKWKDLIAYLGVSYIELRSEYNDTKVYKFILV